MFMRGKHVECYQPLSTRSSAGEIHNYTSVLMSHVVCLSNACVEFLLHMMHIRYYSHDACTTSTYMVGYILPNTKFFHLRCAEWLMVCFESRSSELLTATRLSSSFPSIDFFLVHSYILFFFILSSSSIPVDATLPRGLSRKEFLRITGAEGWGIDGDDGWGSGET